jgi:hypothetical protein
MAVNRRRARGTRIKLIEHVRTLDRKSLKLIGYYPGFSDGHTIHSSLRHIMGLTSRMTILAEPRRAVVNRLRARRTSIKLQTSLLHLNPRQVWLTRNLHQAP